MIQMARLPSHEQPCGPLLCGRPHAKLPRVSQRLCTPGRWSRVTFLLGQEDWCDAICVGSLMKLLAILSANDIRHAGESARSSF